MSALLPNKNSPILAIQSAEDEDGFMNILVEMKDEANNKTPYSERCRYHEEWQRLFEVDGYFAKLRLLGQRGKLRSSSFRSICWKLYLECLPEDQSEWIKSTWASRQKYMDLQQQLSTNPRLDGDCMDLTFNNPLSQEIQSPWNRFFQDGELKLTIRQDVIRTFPEVKFFHTPVIQSMMVNILFSYAREFPEISYRQGMHELLAPLIFVLHSDQQAFLHASDNNLISQEIREILDPEFTEHDAFLLFCKVMDLVQSWYISGEHKHHKMEHLKLAPFSQPPEFGPNSYIEVKLTKIHNLLLRQQDPELYNHLKNMEIAPQIYGIRWLRLLFGREFSLADLLVIWDAIFGNGISFDLVDHIFCAMLMSIREPLLRGDYTTCLKHLMRYPPTSDANYVLDLALHLKEPLTYSKPSGCSNYIQNNIPRTRPDVYSQHAIQNINQTDGNLKNGALRPKSLVLTSTNSPFDNNSKSSSEPMTVESKSPSPEQENVFRRIIRRPSFNGQSSSKPQSNFKHHQRHQSDDLDSLVHRDVAQLINGTVKKQMNGTDIIDLRKSGLSQSMSQLDKRSAVVSGNVATTVCKEMLPLRSCNSSTTALAERNSLMRSSSRNRSHDKEEELRLLRMDVSQLRAMKDYCWSRMTRHLDRLQDALVKQELQHEDELFLALAGLKRVRDILKGTLTFSEEVISDEEVRDSGAMNADDECGWQFVNCNGEQELSPTSTQQEKYQTGGLESYRREIQKLLLGLTGESKTKTTK